MSKEWGDVVLPAPTDSSSSSISASVPVAAATTSKTVHVGLHGMAPVFDSTKEECIDYD